MNRGVAVSFTVKIELLAQVYILAIFTTFLFPLATPLGQSRQMLYGWKENSMLTNCLAACAHLTIAVAEIEQDICEKIVILSYPLHSTLPSGGGGSHRNFATPFGMEKLEWWGYPMVKNIEDMCNRLCTIPACDRQTDGQT